MVRSHFLIVYKITTHCWSRHMVRCCRYRHMIRIWFKLHFLNCFETDVPCSSNLFLHDFVFFSSHINFLNVIRSFLFVLRILKTSVKKIARRRKRSWRQSKTNEPIGSARCYKSSHIRMAEQQPCRVFNCVIRASWPQTQRRPSTDQPASRQAKRVINISCILCLLLLLLWWLPLQNYICMRQ